MGIEVLGMAGPARGEPAAEAEREVLGLFLAALGGGAGGSVQGGLGLAGGLGAALLAAAAAGEGRSPPGLGAPVGRRQRCAGRPACIGPPPLVGTGPPGRACAVGPGGA